MENAAEKYIEASTQKKKTKKALNDNQSTLW